MARIIIEDGDCNITYENVTVLCTRKESSDVTTSPFHRGPRRTLCTLTFLTTSANSIP